MGLCDFVTADLGTDVVGVGVHTMKRWVLRPMGVRGLRGEYCWLRSVVIRSRADCW